MPLSKARMRARKRIDRMNAGVKPDANLAISALPPDVRKAVLKEIALHGIEKPVTAGHKIAAIKELNLMEHIYDPSPPAQDNRVYNILVADDDTKQAIKRLISGRKEA